MGKLSFWKFAGIVEVVLVMLESYFPHSLPLAGSHIAQLGLLFGGAFVLAELASMFDDAP
ncbi:hypothetical protein LJR175_008152 [Variovorax sp. LjRoot175]|uniref:hypothetical protein n=1 Tax=Variovorax sp. LjRoot175 TaxID=3342276 RepID=UPI003ECEE043